MPIIQEEHENSVTLVSPAVESHVVSTKKVHKQYNPTDLVELAESIQSAKEFVDQNAISKLTIIAQQMAILEEVS
uniref:Uncharacterized protein n=1 Tax=Panagrolaimus sp. JU765 TaxID=591449 RepID=A0AC34Q9A8_9BILA